MEEIENPSNNQAQSKNRIKNFLLFGWEIVKIAVIALIIVAPIRYFLFQPFIVSGESMSPNFENGDYLIVNEISYRFAPPARGDVIVFKAPPMPNDRFIKRVIGLPGETVDIRNGQVTITTTAKKTFILTEKYLPADLKTYGDTHIVLSATQYFVMGDNREKSYDSRSWGSVPKGNIIGEAAIRIFPLTAFEIVPKPNY